MILGRAPSRIFPATVLGLTLVSCSGSPSGSTVLTADMPLHLEEHLDVATIVGSAVPADVPTVMEWHLNEPQEDWNPVVAGSWNPTIDPVEVTQLDDALRVTLTEGTRNPDGVRRGGLVLEVPNWNHEDLAHLVLRARTADGFTNLHIDLNRREGTGTDTDSPMPFEYLGEVVPVISDGTVQTYRLRLDFFRGRPPPGGSIRQIALMFVARGLASIDILSITVIPKVANYADAGAAARTEIRNQIYRQAVYTHTPGSVEYRVRIPEGGRLDFGMGVLREDVPVTFRVTAIPDGAGGGEPTGLFEERYAGKEAWGQRSVDLADFAGQTVTLGLEAESEDEGRVALWGAPTVAGSGQSSLPNIIFYVIDGAGADFMSVYGYNRRTTPNVERIAAEGAVFEYAHSNSGWTKPSTASFMTSLQHSVLGGFGNPRAALPDSVVTMAQRLHRAGYQTAVFTTNPNAGSLSDLQHGVDVFRDQGMGYRHSISSVELHRNFWDWRTDYPGMPYWVHFQTTDVHEIHRPVAPFAGLFVSPEERARQSQLDRWGPSWEQCDSGEWLVSISGFMRRCLESLGVDPVWYFDTQRGLYDETMAHQDYQLGRLVERLKAEGEWENTLLIIASDHGHPAGGFSRFGRGLFDPPPPDWEGALADSYRTRIPLIFVWPGHIAPGQRFSERVSMIDMLPTILDLVDLPFPEVMQGQSLAPLLFGTDGWEERPVILEQVQNDVVTGEFTGHIEIIDGQWAASLEIWPERGEDDPPVQPSGSQRAARPHVPGTPRLLLYDLRSDPFTLKNVNDLYPELVDKYTQLLEAQWDAHQVLRQHVGVSTAEVELTPEQLRTLRSLGYIQ